MSRMLWLGTFADLVIVTLNYGRRRIEALMVGTMFDPFHFTTPAERIERAAFRIKHKTRSFARDFEHVVSEARAYFAKRLQEEAASPCP